MSNKPVLKSKTGAKVLRKDVKTKRFGKINSKKFVVFISFAYLCSLF